MAQEFIKELERLKAKQAEQGGLNAPAPVAPGFQPQAPQELSAPELGPTLANEAQLPVLAPAVQAPQGQAPMLGGFEVRGAGAERFDLGTPEVPETLFSKEYTDPGGNTAAIAGIEAERAKAQIPTTQDKLVPSAVEGEANPSIYDTVIGNLAESKFGKYLGGMTTYDLNKGGNVVIGSGTPTFEDIAEKTQVPAFGSGPGFKAPATNPMGVTPEVMATPESIAGLSVNGTDVVTPEAITEAAPAVIQAPELPQQPLPPVMDGSQIPKAGEEGFKFAERGSPQDYFLSQTNDGTTPLSSEQITRGQEYAKQQGLNFDPTTGFSQNTEAPQAQLPSTIQNAGGQNLAGFKPKYEGQSLTDYMAGRDDPSAASVQVQDPQGRFRRQAASVAGETPEQNQSRTDALFPEQADFEQASADREARQAARPDFGKAVSDRDRRAARGEGMSDADRRDIAKASMPGASVGDIARGAKVAALNGIDPKTGKAIEGKSTVAEDRLEFDKEKYADIQAKEAKGVPLTPSEQLQKERFEYLKAKDEETKAAKTTPEQIEKDRLAEEAAVLDNERKRQVIAKGNEPDATSMQKKKGEWEEMKEDMVENNMPEDEIAARRKAFLYGDKFDAFSYGGKAADEVEMTDAKGIRRLVLAKDKEEAIKNGYTLV